MSNDNSVESSTDTNKNLSEYEQIWKRVRESINITAKDYVPRLYHALKQEGYTAKEARDKIKKDAFNVWSAKTIDEFIPVEAKEPIKVLAGQLGQEKKKEIKDSAPETRTEQSPVWQKEADYASSVPREEVKEEEPIQYSTTKYYDIVEDKNPQKEYNLTVYFAGKDCTLKIIIEQNKIVKVIPASKYIQYSLS